MTEPGPEDVPAVANEPAAKPDAADPSPAESRPAADAGPTDAGLSRPSIVLWVVAGTWQATVDSARALAPTEANITLLHVAPDDLPAAGRAAYAGLLGRGRPGRDPGIRMDELAAASAAEFLDAAADRLAGPCTRLVRRGRPERVVVAEAEGADLLIVARDSDRSRLGPKSLGKETRFVVDHAPCPVLLVWPEAAPGTSTIPPPPPHHHPKHPHPPHHDPEHRHPPHHDPHHSQ